MSDDSASLRRLSVVDELARVLRGRILDGEISPGTPLREVDLATSFDVSRHTLRAALRVLAGEGLVRIEPNRGASVAHLEPGALVALFDVRTALEVEAARRALERGGGRLPLEVHRSLGVLATVCRRKRPSWRAVAEAHAGLHGALVRAADSPGIAAAYERLAGELRLFVVQLRPSWSLERMIGHHEALLEGLERDGPEVLREHLADGLAAILPDGSAPVANKGSGRPRPLRNRA